MQVWGRVMLGGRAGQIVGLVAAAALAAGCGASRAAPSRPAGTPVPVVAAVTATPRSPAVGVSSREPGPTAAPSRATPAPMASPAPGAPTAPAPSPAPPPTPAPLGLELRRQIFNEVWTTIHEHYLYPDFGGVDWVALRSEFEPRIEEAPTDEAFYEQLRVMVGRLGDDHSRFLPPQAAQRQDKLSSGRDEQVGIGAVTLPLRDGLLIQHVFPDSPADRAGLQARDRIVAVDGQSYTVTSIEGPEGTQVRLTVVRPGDEVRDMVISRRRVEGRIMPIARRLPDDIAYLGVTTLWVNDMDQQVGRALADLTAAAPPRGIILDLRSNPGGWRNVLTGILGHFVTGEVGSFTSRKGDTPLLIDAVVQPDLRGVPLVILIDGGTASYAELIAAVLQGQAGAVVLGTPSAGNTETIYSYELTGGARLWVAQEGFRLLGGGDLEGTGVQPDITIPEDWTRFSETDDPAIIEALRLLTPDVAGK